MNVERRLHHAARELREVTIVVPPLGRPRRDGAATRVLQALAAPLLFVAGGLFAVGAMQQTSTVPTQSDIVTGTVGPAGGPAAVVEPAVGPATVSTDDDTATRAVSAPSVRAELEMIAAIVSSNQAARAEPEPAAGESPPSEPVDAGIGRPDAAPEPIDAVGPI